MTPDEKSLIEAFNESGHMQMGDMTLEQWALFAKLHTAAERIVESIESQPSPTPAPDQLREQGILRDRLDEELSLGVDAGSLEIMVQDWLREVLPERILTQLFHAERVELLGVRFND